MLYFLDNSTNTFTKIIFISRFLQLLYYKMILTIV